MLVIRSCLFEVGLVTLVAILFFSLVVPFCAGGAGDVIKDCRLNSTPEPGHDGGLRWL